MTTAGQIARNRANALRSTGPRTPGGLASSARNARRHGFYTDAVVPEAGESPEEFDALRDALHSELRPEGVLEARLADRVALLLWRLDRVARYEAATAAAAVAASAAPPDPDAVTGAGVDTCFDPPPHAPPADRLAFARARLRDWEPCRDACRAAADALGGAGSDPIPPGGLSAVVAAVGESLGWAGGEASRQWSEAVRALPAGTPLAGEAFRSLAARLARAAGRDPDAALPALRDRLAARAASYDEAMARMGAEADRLAGWLRAARGRAVGAALYADDAAAGRVVRVEGHLARQLDAALSLLRRLRGGEAAGVVAGVGVVVRGVRAGSGGVVPIPVGSFRSRPGGEEDAGGETP